MSRTIVVFHVYIMLGYPITYINPSVLCQSECACLHKTVNMVAFFLKMMKIPTQKGEHPCKCTELSLKRKDGNVWVAFHGVFSNLYCIKFKIVNNIE